MTEEMKKLLAILRPVVSVPVISITEIQKKKIKENKINNVVKNTAKEKIMTEEQKKKCEEIYNSYNFDFRFLLIKKDEFIKITISLAKVFNKDITEEEAEKIISINKVISGSTNPINNDIATFWAIVNYFDKGFDKKQEQKKKEATKIKEIINLAEEKYKKDLEELLRNFHDKYVPWALLFHYGDADTIYYWYNPIEMLFGYFVLLSFTLSQMEGKENEFFEFLGNSKDKAAEIIIDITVSLSEIFNKNMTKEEAEKLLFIKNDIEKEDMGAGIPAGLGKFCVFTEEFRKIIEEYYKKDKYGIERVILAIADYFNGKENYNNKNNNEEKNKNFNKENKINNVVENTAKEKIMTEEQKKKCEEIINSCKTKLGDVDISLLANPFSSIFSILQSAHQYVEITHMTISLAKVFNKDISEEEAKKIIFELKEDLKENRDDEKYKDFESMSWAIVDKLDDELILNLLILGQTGTGKSSIVNALVGDDVEKTSIGKPETPKERKNEAGEIERGIYPHPHEIDGKKVVIYDSWGLEVDKATEWEDIIEEELKKRSEDKDIKDWFHSVTYCIQAGGYKIQDFDIKMIKLFMDKKYNVIVALTKSDQIAKAKREKFIKEIEKAIKIKIITYRALIKSNLINEVKKEFIKEIEKEIGEIEFEQIEETKSDMYPTAATLIFKTPIFIPPINLKYNIVKCLMKSNQIEQSKIEKFIKEIKETTKIGITVIPISANPEQLDHMTEKPKPYGLEEYKAAILLSWEKIFIDRIPLHIIEKLKKDIENAKYNAPNRKPKNDDDLKILAKEIQEYFNNVLKENLQSRIKENFEKYYKITEDIININTNIDISNFYSRKNIDPDTYLYDYIGFSISHLFEHIKDLFKYLYNRMKIKENIEEFINKTYKETKEYISKKEFEDNIRKSIIDIFNKIENKKN